MADERLIIALDTPTAPEALAIAEQIGPAGAFYKIGLGMLTGGGLAAAIELKEEMGKRIFLDMKLFDISNTVRAAVAGLTAYDLDFLTVHGDPHVVKAAQDGNRGSTKILAVTMLTSLDRADLDDALIKPGEMGALVVERAARAFEAGADGVIASPHEAAAIRALPEANGKLIVTPGVRPKGLVTGDDQKRVMTPAEALDAGADHLVIGRPVTGAADPAAAMAEISASLP